MMMSTMSFTLGATRKKQENNLVKQSGKKGIIFETRKS
jgi:hypothetical protein